MSHYSEYMKIAEKRKMYDQIETSMSVFINLFEESDKRNIIDILYKIYIVSEFFSGLTVGLLCLGISYFINDDIYLLFLCSLAFLIICIFRIDRDGLIEKKIQFIVLSKNCKSSYYKFYFRTIFNWSKNELLLKGIFPYTLGLFGAGIMQKRAVSFFALAIFSVVIQFIVLLCVNIYCSYNLSIKKVINRSQLACCFLLKENDMKIKKYKDHIGYELLIKRLFYQKHASIVVKILSVSLSMIILVVWLILLINKTDINIMNVVILSIFPVLPNAMLTGVVYNGLFQRDFIVSTFYYNRKFDIQKKLNNILFKESLLSISYLIIPMVLLIIINLRNFNCIFGVFLNILHCICVVFLVSSRISKITWYSYEKLNSAIVGKITSNGFEDYIIVGLPLIMISGSIMNYVLSDSMLTIIRVYSIFIALVVLYVILKTILQRIYSKKAGNRFAKDM